MAVALTIQGPLAPADVPALAARACVALERDGGEPLVCVLRDVAADAVAVDALAHLRLAAVRRGRRVRLCGASDELRELVAFLGLGDVLVV